MPSTAASTGSCSASASTTKPISCSHGVNWKPKLTTPAGRRSGADRRTRIGSTAVLYNPDDRRLSGLSFEERLALVLEKRSKYWKRTVNYYALRNQIAHGTLRSHRIEVTSVVQEFYLIQSSLSRS